MSIIDYMTQVETLERILRETQKEKKELEHILRGMKLHIQESPLFDLTQSIEGSIPAKIFDAWQVYCINYWNWRKESDEIVKHVC